MLLAPLVKDRKGTYEELFARYLAQGYVRARVDGQVYQLEEKIKLDRYVKHNIELVVDRLVIKKDTRDNEEAKKRLTDSVELTLNLGEREMLVNLVDEKEDVYFSERLVDPATGKSFAGNRAAYLLLQFAPRRLPGLQRPGLHQGSGRQERLRPGAVHQ